MKRKPLVYHPDNKDKLVRLGNRLINLKTGQSTPVISAPKNKPKA